MPRAANTTVVRPAWASASGGRTRGKEVTPTRAKRKGGSASDRLKEARSETCEPTNRNRIRGGVSRGKRPTFREAPVTKGGRRRSGGCAGKAEVLIWGDLALGLKGPRCGSRRSEKSAEAVVPAEAGEGSNGREGQSTVDLEGVMPQKSRKLELPSKGLGEAGTYRRSEETQAAEEGDEGSGARDSGGFRRPAA
jgi:hypothetical protein